VLGNGTDRTFIIPLLRYSITPFVKIVLRIRRSAERRYASSRGAVELGLTGARNAQRRLDASGLAAGLR